MFMIGQKIDERAYSWKAKAAQIHAKRWEYLHSEMHAAGYALDPEFMQMASDMDEATQSAASSRSSRRCACSRRRSRRRSSVRLRQMLSRA